MESKLTFTLQVSLGHFLNSISLPDSEKLAEMFEDSEHESETGNWNEINFICRTNSLSNNKFLSGKQKVKTNLVQNTICKIFFENNIFIVMFSKCSHAPPTPSFQYSVYWNSCSCSTCWCWLGSVRDENTHQYLLTVT